MLSEARRFGAMSISIVALTIGCTGSLDSRPGVEPSAEADAGQDDTPTEGSATSRDLDLSWREECHWLGVETDSSEDLLEVVPLSIWLDEGDLEHLYSRDVTSNERLGGEFAIGPDETRLPLDPGLRFRGNTARGSEKKSFNIRFPGHVEAFSSDRINLNAMYTDPAQLREHLSFEMFRDVGVPAPRTRFVDLHLNGVYEGLYLAIQRVDEALLEEHGLPPGGSSLVRDRTRHAVGEYTSMFSVIDMTTGDRSAVIEQAEQYVDTRWDPDWEALAELLVWTNHDPDQPESRSDADELIDVDAFVDWLAVLALTGNIDSFADDYWLFRAGVGDARWRVIPWDTDLSFGSHYDRDLGGVANDLFHIEFDPTDTATEINPLLRELLSVGDVQDRFDGRLAELRARIDLPWVCEVLTSTVPAIEGSATREPDETAFHLHPANHHSTAADHPLHVAALLDFLQLRSAFLERHQAPEGATDIATRTIGPEDVGRSVLFTDATGWTLARLDVEDVTTPGEVTIEVGTSTASNDVDRAWVVDAPQANIRGKLSLYYRNTRRFDNWYTAFDDLEPVVGQADLAIVSLRDDGREPLPSVANPYANRVMAEVLLTGTTEFLVERQPS